MGSSALVSVKVNKPVVEVITGGNGVQMMIGVRLVVHSTWNRSLVGADHCRVVLVAVTLTPLMDGGGRTKTVKLLFVPTGGRPLSVTTVVNLNSPPPSGAPGVQVMMPLVSVAAVDVAGEVAR